MEAEARSRCQHISSDSTLYVGGRNAAKPVVFTDDWLKGFLQQAA
jgi:hypothetical protein